MNVLPDFQVMAGVSGCPNLVYLRSSSLWGESTGAFDAEDGPNSQSVQPDRVVIQPFNRWVQCPILPPPSVPAPLMR